MVLFNYLGSGMICVLIYFIIADMLLSKKHSIINALGRTVVLVILFAILVRT